MHTQFWMTLLFGDRKGLGVKAEAGNHQLVVLLGRSNRFLKLQSRDRSILRAERDCDGVAFAASVAVPRPFRVNQRAGSTLEHRIEMRESPALIAKECQTVGPQM